MAYQSQTPSEIEATIKTFFSLVSNRDLRVLDEFAAGNDVLLVGSDEGEIARGQASIEAFFTKLFARPSTLAWQTDRVAVSQAGEIAWFFAEGEMTLDSADGQEKGPYRISGVVERGEIAGSGVSSTAQSPFHSTRPKQNLGPARSLREIRPTSRSIGPGNWRKFGDGAGKSSGQENWA
jgi:ketosteroid isomerase-like protein